MIPVSTTVAQPVMTPGAPSTDTARDVPLHEVATHEMSRPEQPANAPARLPASHELHAQVQGAAYAAPNGAGGASGASGQVVDPRKAAQAYMAHGVAALKAHRYNEAIESFREAYRLFPSPRILMNLGAALRDSGQFAEAVVVYEQYLSDPGRDPARDDEVRTAMEGARAKLGGQSYSADDIAQSKVLMAQGEQAARAGRWDEALQAFRSAHAHNPLPAFLNNQAFCLEKLNAPLAAAMLHRQFADATPNAGDAAKARASAERLSTLGANAPITASGLAGGMEWLQRGNALLRDHKSSRGLGDVYKRQCCRAAATPCRRRGPTR